MSRTLSEAAPASPLRPAPALALGGLAILGAGLALPVLLDALPAGRWASAALAPSPRRMEELVFAYAVLPRMAGALLAGALLGLAGAVFGQVIRNPLATPDTVGVTAGAQLALAAITIAAPSGLTVGRFAVALAGGGTAVGLVLLLSLRDRFAAATLLLVGLTVSLLLDALATLLVLFNAHDLWGLTVWAGGSLAVQDWDPVITLVSTAVIPVAVLAGLTRPLALFAVDDASVRALGGHATAIRLASLAVAVTLAAAVCSSFGPIGFVSLAAPALARLTGVRRIGPVMAWSALVGGLMLWSTDDAALLAGHWLGVDLAAGSAVAILGAPVLVGLAIVRRGGQAPAPAEAGGTRRLRPAVPLLLLGAAVLLAGGAGLAGGRGSGGWAIAWPAHDLVALLPWRGPRTTAAGAAGALLGLSGFLLQRVTANPIAAPEMLGLGAGAGAGLLVATLVGAGPAMQAVAVLVGAIGTAMVLLSWMTVGRVEPARTLVPGLALASAIGSLVGAFAATGDPRGLQVMVWMTGSTNRVAASAAAGAAGMAVLAVPVLILAARWLDLMPLGPATRQGLGLPERHAGALLVLFAAVLAGCGTLLVGPLSFVGLVAPRLAVASGLPRALAQGGSAMLIGALLMIVADELARTIAFPWQMPTGIVAALLGSPVLILLLGRARL